LSPRGTFFSSPFSSPRDMTRIVALEPPLPFKFFGHSRRRDAKLWVEAPFLFPFNCFPALSPTFSSATAVSSDRRLCSSTVSLFSPLHFEKVAEGEMRAWLPVFRIPFVKGINAGRSSFFPLSLSKNGKDLRSLLFFSPPFYHASAQKETVYFFPLARREFFAPSLRLPFPVSEEKNTFFPSGGKEEFLYRPFPFVIPAFSFGQRRVHGLGVAKRFFSFFSSCT